MTRSIVFFLLLLTALRLGLIGQMELSPDEAYYTLWSERLDWAYYSKGPGVALAIRAGTALFGQTEFGVRFFSPLLGLGTSLLLFALARRMAGPTAGALAVLMMNLTPIFNVGSLVMTIDPLSIFFWVAAAYAFWRALERSPAFSWWWPLAGALTGLGFLCKYTNAVLLLSVILFLCLGAKQRREFARPGFWSALALFAVCLLPPIIWNARHAWITVSHLRARGGLDSGFAFDPLEGLAFLGVHFGVYSPLIFAGILMAIPAAWREARVHLKPRFLLALGLPLFAGYVLLSFKEAGEANWTAPAFVTLGVAAAAYWGARLEASETARRWVVAALALGALASALLLNTDLVRAAGIPWAYRVDPSTRLRGWRTAAQSVQELRERVEAQIGQRVFLIANKYQTAAALAFYLPEKRVEQPGHPTVYIPESQAIQNQFSFWGRYDEFAALAPGQAPPDAYFTEQKGVNLFLDRTALYITDRDEEKPAESIQSGFAKWELVGVIDITRRGRPLRTLRVFACYQYQTLPL